MTSVRAAAWIVLAGSIAAATPGDAERTGPRPLRESHTDPTPLSRVVSADFHVHAFPGDGALPPWDIRREAARRGLDAVAVTNHNQMHAARLDAVISDAFWSPPARPLLITGVELTAPDYHLVALGIRNPIDWRLPLADAIRAVHAQNGVAIAAHPTSSFWERLDAATIARLDGIEVAHPIALRNSKARASIDALFERARRIKPGIAPIGSSDYHFAAPIGLCRTRLLVRELTAHGILDAIRAGRTAAVDSTGRIYGSAETIAATEHTPANGQDARSGTAASSTRRHIARAAAWLALVVLICAGSPPNDHTKTTTTS